VWVHGVQRSWNQLSPHSKICAVGAVFKADVSCNGVSFLVSENQLPEFDKRESNYDRVLLKPDQIFLWESQKPFPGKCWIYLPKQPKAPSQECPIAQSYIDVAMSGCLEISEAFAEEFVTTTAGWNFLCNDRKNPKYRMPMEEVPFAEQIDHILKKKVKWEFKE